MDYLIIGDKDLLFVRKISCLIFLL